MNWEKSETVPEFTGSNHLLIVYGTSAFSDSLLLSEILTPEELTYSERLRGEGQKSTWLSCRATLRMILESYLGKQPLEIEFRKGRFGKLFLADTNLCFNVSHSKHAFLLGFGLSGRIGIDIELLNGSEDLPSLVNYAFSENEARYCHNGENPALFAEVWTLKEAFLKAAGIGLVDELNSVTVTGDTPNEITRFNLNRKTFLCPNEETGSVVYKKNMPLKFVWLT